MSRFEDSFHYFDSIISRFNTDTWLHLKILCIFNHLIMSEIDGTVD